jgi:putative DNA primase/helicase
MSDDAGMFEPISKIDIEAVSITSNDPPGGFIYVAPPGEPTEQDYRHPHLGNPTAVWPYRDAAGEIEGYMCRFDHVGAGGERDKQYRPLRHGTWLGRTGWHWKGWRDHRPLYRLPQLLARPDAPILVCEGEKTAERAAQIFPEYAVTTAMHGAQSPGKTDWSSLHDRSVTILPDNDDAGAAFAIAVARLATTAGATTVSIVKLPEGLPAKWDVADELPPGITEEQLREAVVNAGVHEDAAADAAADDTSNVDDTGDIDDISNLDDIGNSDDIGNIINIGDVRKSRRRRTSPFQLRDDGVYKKIDTDDGVEWRRLCSYLEVAAATRDAASEAWGRLLIVTDGDGVKHSWAMPMDMLATDGAAYRQQLLSLGLIIEPGKFAKDALHEYISTANPPRKARCVGRIGWHDTSTGSVFVLPDATFGSGGDEDVLLQSAIARAHAFNVAGTLDDWKNTVATYCVGNSRLVFAVSAAFAATLLAISGAESGGINFFGPSRTGKTTMLWAAASVWGGGGVKGYITQWRATSNGLEGVAAKHCDALLVLDEMGQVDGREAGDVSYMLANGAGKSRAGRDGAARRSSEWRSLFLSSAELTLADKMQEAGKRAKAGQEVRIADIPAVAGSGMGVFENLHDVNTADEFARLLMKASKQTYGAPIRAFLRELASDIAADPHEVQRGITENRDEFIKRHVPPGASGQVLTVASRCALIAHAGSLATSYGITGWDELESDRAAAACFAAWLELRGGAGDRETQKAIEQVRAFLEQHGSSRFEAAWEKNGLQQPYEQRAINRAGFRKRGNPGSDDAWDYYVLPRAWSEICKGYDSKAAASALAERGLLVRGDDRKLSISLHVPQHRQVRLYHLKAAILGGDRCDE